MGGAFVGCLLGGCMAPQGEYQMVPNVAARQQMRIALEEVQLSRHEQFFAATAGGEEIVEFVRKIRLNANHFTVQELDGISRILIGYEEDVVKSDKLNPRGVRDLMNTISEQYPDTQKFRN
jgi:hypothetical protein